jgi:hypothetical protein
METKTESKPLEVEKRALIVYSFDRFGDHLCEQLLSYLSLKEKIGFECISKQCKELVFNKQHVLNIFLISDSGSDSDSNSSDLCERTAENTIHLKNINENETQFKALLKKFKFIKEIEIKEENYSCIKDFIIKSLIESQKYLEKVLFIGEIDRNVFIEFAKNCGQKLKYFDLILSFWDNNNYRLFNEEELIQVLQNSPNLRTIGSTS